MVIIPSEFISVCLYLSQKRFGQKLERFIIDWKSADPKPVHSVVYLILVCNYGRKALNWPLQRHLRSHNTVYALLSSVTMVITAASLLAGLPPACIATVISCRHRTLNVSHDKFSNSV